MIITCIPKDLDTTVIGKIELRKYIGEYLGVYAYYSTHQRIVFGIGGSKRYLHCYFPERIEISFDHRLISPDLAIVGDKITLTDVRVMVVCDQIDIAESGDFQY